MPVVVSVCVLPLSLGIIGMQDAMDRLKERGFGELRLRKRERLFLGARWLLRRALGGLRACARSLHINSIYFSQV